MGFQPLVSIALSVFNGEATLGPAIRSVLLQTYQNWELIILDDASTDRSLNVIKQFDDERIRVISGDENLGLSSRLNMAMDLARGNYYARMDQDDICYPDRLQEQVSYLEAHKDVDLLATQALLFRDDGLDIGKLLVTTEHNLICRTAWAGFYVPHPTWMGRIEWFRKFRYQSYADGVEDQHLLYRSFRKSKFACLDKPLLGYRMQPRKLKSMLKKRTLFARSFSRVAIQDGDYIVPIWISLIQLAKGLGDILDVVISNDWHMSTRLISLQEEEKNAWKELLRELDNDLS